MKPDLIKSKLQLKKQAISNLTNTELNIIKGGAEEQWTTSKRACTGFLCCEPPGTLNCSMTLCCTTITLLCDTTTILF